MAGGYLGAKAGTNLGSAVSPRIEFPNGGGFGSGNIELGGGGAALRQGSSWIDNIPIPEVTGIGVPVPAVSGVSAVSAGVATDVAIVAEGNGSGGRSNENPRGMEGFDNLQNATFEEILSRIPPDARQRILSPQPGKVTEGVDFTWTNSDGVKMTVRIHGLDPSAPAGSNSANGWIVRVQQGKRYLDPVSGELQPRGISNPLSEHFNENIINNTHIPIKEPNGWRELLQQWRE